MDLSSKPAEAHTLEAFMDGPFLQWVSHFIRFYLNFFPLCCNIFRLQLNVRFFMSPFSPVFNTVTTVSWSQKHMQNVINEVSYELFVPSVI